MDFQAYNKILIPEKQIKNVKVEGVVIGYEFNIKYPSYRGTFLSCIEELRFEVDGKPVPKDAIYFILNGKQFLIDEIPECYKEYWFVRDRATVRVNVKDGISAGEHKVNIFIKHRVPYTGIIFGEYLVLDSDVTKVMTAN